MSGGSWSWSSWHQVGWRQPRRRPPHTAPPKKGDCLACHPEGHHVMPALRPCGAEHDDMMVPG
eukprot:8273303-Prorocentrum_lima.AAC.1